MKSQGIIELLVVIEFLLCQTSGFCSVGGIGSVEYLGACDIVKITANVGLDRVDSFSFTLFVSLVQGKNILR